MKLNIVILEDNEIHARHLKGVIESAANTMKLTVGVMAVPTGLDITGEMAVRTDLFFLDVETPHRNGLETAKFIRTVSQNVPLVFTTSHRIYAVQGYEVQAFRFLLKPVTESDCIPCLKSAVSYVRFRDQGCLQITRLREQWIVPYRDILYIESRDHACRIVTDNEAYTYRKNLASLIKELPDRLFVQCHRSYLVNLDRIRVLRIKALILDNESTLPLSESYYEAVERAIAGKLTVEGGRWQ